MFVLRCKRWPLQDRRLPEAAAVDCLQNKVTSDGKGKDARFGRTMNVNSQLKIF